MCLRVCLLAGCLSTSLRETREPVAHISLLV